ncbi:MAG TPA: glycosyltransferase, partial [Bacteroidia bacterium]|nr:glycosyltransferase [Bacteroidia bacterium]
MKISIVTITYNSAATIEDTIKSVVVQDYPDMEYLLI